MFARILGGGARDPCPPVFYYAYAYAANTHRERESP